jgi:hypothetical protein
MNRYSARSCYGLVPVVVVASALVITTTRARSSELFSESVAVPPLVTYGTGPVSGWNNFNILVNTTPLPTQDATDTNSDPFAVNGISTITTGPYIALATDASTSVGPGPIKIPGLTHVMFTGTKPINLADIPDQGISNPTDQVQFGLTGPTDNGVMNFLGQHWGGNYFATPVSSTALGYLRSVPIVSVTPHPAPPSMTLGPEAFDYIVDFIKFTQNGITGSEWVEFPYLPGQQPTFTYSGWADAADAIHFTENFVQISPTMIPLDDLNYADDPPPILDPLPGAPTLPAFATVDNPDDIVVAAPEPGVMAIMLGAAMAIGRRRK